jgi:PRTRC genetic system protein E
MFTELEQLLVHRTLLLTLSGGPDGLIRVNVLPKCLKESDAAEIALATPLSITGTAADLDRELPIQLTTYTKSVLETSSTLEQLRATHKAALKELEAENKKALEAKRKSGSSSKPATKADDGTDKQDKRVAEAKPTPPVASLFDDPPEPEEVARNASLDHVTEEGGNA